MRPTAVTFLGQTSSGFDTTLIVVGVAAVSGAQALAGVAVVLILRGRRHTRAP